MVQYRVKALNQLQKPDELDVLMRVTKRRGWLALGALFLLAGGVIAWGFGGELPLEVTGSGLLSKPAGETLLESTVAGQVLEVAVSDGDEVDVGGELITIATFDGEEEVVTTRFGGTITGVLVDEGNVVDVGETLVTIERNDVPNNRLLAFVFLDSGQGRSVAPGMDVDLEVSSAPPAAFGVLRGTVTEVGPFPESEDELIDLLGNPELAALFSEDGPPIRVTVDFTADETTASGYRWSTENGPPFPLGTGTLVEATIIQGDQSPIDLVFGR